MEIIISNCPPQAGAGGGKKVGQELEIQLVKGQNNYFKLSQNSRLKTEPLPGSDCTEIDPLCNLIICLERLNPMPDPFFFVV